ncbi:FIST signal transduction protein [Vibrio metoecus]|uniref:FIST signal transduction protein n=1 Tax=Vibrio metoecus TaxID=1481663 RepID=UPI00272D79BB|nr:FIST N-terminal domain-containing protein [Vibrio metoecus]WKY94412.1 FIST N-terminal domain-containing protein [Vibrio metoecus]
MDKKDLSNLVCYFTQEFDAEQLAASLIMAFPNIPIIGCSSCRGVMTQDGYFSNPAVGLLGIYDLPKSAYTSALVCLDEHPCVLTLVDQVIDDALSRVNRSGELPSLVLLHATPGIEETLIESIDNKFGSQVPIIGGSAADNYIDQDWSIFTEQGATHKGVALQLMFPSQSVFSGFSAGYSPTEFSGFITKAKGRVIEEIDGEPASNLYKEWVGDHSGILIGDEYIFDHVTRFPLGRAIGENSDFPQYKLTHPVRRTDTGGLEVFANVEVGELVSLMTGSQRQLIERVSRVIQEASYKSYLDKPLLGSLTIFCAGSMLRLGKDIHKVHHKMLEQLDGCDFICPFTFGEQGRFINGENAHGNLMISSVVFCEE